MLIKLVAINFINLFLLTSVILGQSQPDQNLSRLGEQYFQNKDYERSLEVFTKLTAENPNNQIFFDRYWRSLFETGRYQDAHNAIAEKIKTPNQDLLLNEMARISVIMGKNDQAKSEWNRLKEKYPGNISIVKLIGNTMLQMKQYEWVIGLYQNERKESNKRQYAMELANIFTITYQPEKAAQEYLNLLSDSPSNEGYMDSRISQYFSDSLSSSKMVSFFVSADRSVFPPSVDRLTANLFRNMSQFGKALQYYIAYDKKSNNQGSASLTFLTQRISGMNLDSLQQYSAIFRQEFPGSRLTDQLDVRLFQAFVDQSDFNQKHFEWVEDFYNKSKSKPATAAALSDLYLKAVLKSDSDIQTKRTKILSVIKSQRGMNQSYWLWVLESLSENYSEGYKIFSEAGMKTKMPVEFMNTSNWPPSH